MLFIHDGNILASNTLMINTGTGTWTKVSVDLSKYTGIHYITFGGGYPDYNGGINPTTYYSNINFYE